MKRILSSIWLVLCIGVLFIPLRDIHNGEAHILFAWLMMLLTFPSGFILISSIGSVGYLLDTYFGLMLPPNEIMLFPLWFALVVLGYLQWFILVPKLWRKWLGKAAT